MIHLPPPADLERICKGIAALDAILCDDRALRSYSFDHAWSGAERLASMRDGSGDEWFLVFGPGGVFAKASWHDAPSAPATPIYQGLPASLAQHLASPALSASPATFGGWHDRNAWTLRGHEGVLASELAILGGDPRTYRTYAHEYFEVDVPVEAIAHVLAGKPLDAAVVAEVNATRTLADVAVDMKAIGY